jgi:hypothetical protein
VTPANTTITTTFNTGSPAYPGTATLGVVTQNYGIQFSTLNGTLVNGQYQYTFNGGPHGLAGLGFMVPANAQFGTVTVTSICGNATSTITFKVTKGDAHHSGKGNSGSGDIMPSPDTMPATSAALPGSWSFTLPTNGVPAVAPPSLPGNWVYVSSKGMLVFTFLGYAAD